MAADLFSAVKKQFKLDEIESDNWVFKLFYRASFAICLAGSIMCVATTYIGTPIICDHRTEIKGDLINQYCWLHGSNHIDKKYQEEFGCYSDQKKSESEDKTTAYYQWVVFVLVLNAVLFVLPRQLWKLMEGGTISHFGKEAKSAFVRVNETNMKEMVSKYVKYFNVLRYKTDRYFANFVLCEFLNFCVLVFNFCLTNIFLGHEFSTYGADVVKYYQYDQIARKEMVNPMCNIFPTRVSCMVKYIAPSGGFDKVNGLCILSQNIINEKIFLALWFWYVSLMVISSSFFIYRLATIAVPSVRGQILCSKIGGARQHVRTTVARLLRHSTPGDWFLLNQIGKNTNPYFFRELILAIYDDMKSEHYMEDNGNIDLVKFEDRQGQHEPLNNVEH